MVTSVGAVALDLAVFCEVARAVVPARTFRGTQGAIVTLFALVVTATEINSRKHVQSNPDISNSDSSNSAKIGVYI